MNIKLPNLPSFILNMIILFISVLMVVHAVNTHDVVLAITALILSNIELELDYNNK